MKKPRFKRDSVGRKQIADRWRKPTGNQSKLRLRRRGKGPVVRIGYKKGDPAPEPVRVFRPEDLEKAKDAEGKVLIASGVGGKKREAILKRAKEMKIKISNVRE